MTGTYYLGSRYLLQRQDSTACREFFFFPFFLSNLVLFYELSDVSRPNGVSLTMYTCVKKATKGSVVKIMPNCCPIPGMQKKLRWRAVVGERMMIDMEPPSNLWDGLMMPDQG